MLLCINSSTLKLIFIIYWNGNGHEFGYDMIENGSIKRQTDIETEKGHEIGHKIIENGLIKRQLILRRKRTQNWTQNYCK